MGGFSFLLSFLLSLSLSRDAQEAHDSTPQARCAPPCLPTGIVTTRLTGAAFHRQARLFAERDVGICRLALGLEQKNFPPDRDIGVHETCNTSPS